MGKKLNNSKKCKECGNKTQFCPHFCIMLGVDMALNKQTVDYDDDGKSKYDKEWDR